MLNNKPITLGFTRWHEGPHVHNVKGEHLIGVCTLQWPYMDITMAIFHVFPRYKKINKIKFIEIIFKRTHLSKFIIINLLRMKKSNQNHG
jgi:hypothetical protein